MFTESSQELIDNSSIGIHAVSPEGIVLYANPFELEVLGYEADDYVGHHVSEYYSRTGSGSASRVPNASSRCS